MAPRPSNGPLRPEVHCPTQKVCLSLFLAEFMSCIAHAHFCFVTSQSCFREVGRHHCPFFKNSFHYFICNVCSLFPSILFCTYFQYNAKIKLGRGFTLEELKAAGFNPKYAKTVGISVDHRRTNKSAESLALNVARLEAYKARLVVFPRHAAKPKKGDATAEEIAEARQVKGEVVARATAGDAVTFTAVTEVRRRIQFGCDGCFVLLFDFANLKCFWQA